MKESKEDSDKCKDIPSSWAERFTIIKKAMLSKMLFRFNTVFIKIPTGFCCCYHRNWKADIELRMELQEAPNSQSNLWKEEQRWKTHTSQIQNLGQSYSKKQYGTGIRMIYRPMEKNSESRNKPIYSQLVLTRVPNTHCHSVKK